MPPAQIASSARATATIPTVAPALIKLEILFCLASSSSEKPDTFVSKSLTKNFAPQASQPSI